MTQELENEIISLYESGKHGYEISRTLSIPPHIVYHTLKRKNIPTRPMSEIKRKYKINETCFDTIDEEWKAYFLGLFYADGCITKFSACINLIKIDSHILETLNKFVYVNKPLGIRKETRYIGKNNKEYIGKEQVIFRITNKYINNRLRELGLYERKSLTLEFPSYETIPKHLMRHFIRGYFDGDGCIQIKKWGQRFSVISSYTFCESLYEWMDINLQIKGKIYEENKVCRLMVHNKKDIHTLYHFLYDKSTLYLTRKYDKFKTIVDNLDWGSINRVKYSMTKYVTFDKRRNRWQVVKKLNGKAKFYGSFTTEKDAIDIAEKLQT